METQHKGEMTEAVVLAELKRRNISVSIPFGDNERYDLVADADSEFVRLQVKTGRLADGCVHFHGKSSHTNATGNVYETYDGDTDYFAVYCHELEQLYLIGEQEFNTDMRLRIAEPEVEQPSINWATEFEFDERWPPGDADEQPTGAQEQVIRRLRERDVDVFDAANSNAPNNVVLRTSKDDFYRAVIRVGSLVDGRIRFATRESKIPGPDRVDYVVVNCGAVDERYLVKRAAFDRTFSLRVSEPDQHQPSINWASEYEFDEQWPPS